MFLLGNCEQNIEDKLNYNFIHALYIIYILNTEENMFYQTNKTELMDFMSVRDSTMDLTFFYLFGFFIVFSDLKFNGHLFYTLRLSAVNKCETLLDVVGNIF